MTKAQTNGAVTSNTAGSDELPEGWAAAPLGQFFAPSKEKIEPSRCPDAPYLSLEHIESGTNRIESQGKASDVKSTKAVFHSGDVLYGKLRPYLNKVAIPDFDGVCSTDILVFRSSEGVLQKYLLRFLSQAAFVQYASDHQKGNSLPRVSFGDLAKYPLPLPPLAEQERIVAKVEALLERVNQARERLARVPDLLKRFRQSVLAAACSGRLTADWREDNPGVAHGSELLTEIQSKRDRDSEQQIAEAAARGERRPRQPSYVTIDPTTSIQAPSDLPESWHWCGLGECASVERGRFGVRPRNDPRYYDGPYPFVQIGDLPREGGCINDFTQTLNEKGLGVSRMYPKGTVLIAIVGATIGNTGVLTFDSCCPDSMVAIQGTNEVHSTFIEFYLRRMKLDVRDESYSSGGQPNINLQTLVPYPVPLPPLEEQHELVHRVNALFALVDQIEHRLATATARTERITQSVLAKAFSGELVETEADLARREGRDYEPASVLLERISTKYSAADNGKPKRKRKATRNGHN